MTCDCADDWRLDALDLETGNRKAILPFTSFEFDDLLNQVGPGQITIPVKGVSARDVWPHLTAVAFLRTGGPGATAGNPVCEMIAMVETINPVSDGVVTLGVMSIDNYLNHRIIDHDQSYTSEDQTLIGEHLVNLTIGIRNIPLTGTSDASAVVLSRNYLNTDDKVIGTAVSELTQILGGPDYIRRYTRTGTAWSTALHFSDYAGNTTPRSMNSKRGLTKYGMEVDAADHANWVRGRGDGTLTLDQDFLATSIYPRFDKSVQWSDITDFPNLDQATEGYLNNNQDPTVIPDVTIANLNVACKFALGDSVALNVNHGALRFKGTARIIGRSWASSGEDPPACTFSFAPLDDVAGAVLNAPVEPGSGCC